ncbi:uncharacterized protein LOC110115563 [Dendrobium catenatum]|uniref:uncharacterized protein LOC110115563 n=1 Tax=Dendrobium catenatum TaxID=906689 RepID=UPI0009F72CC2|nr:uncharacterized protein LOC110115563 [Dendrobium catenatum]
MENWPIPWQTLDDEDRFLLEKSFSVKEVEDVIMQSGYNISPSNVGITLSFLKAYWDIIKFDFWNAINAFLESSVMDSNWKETIIVLFHEVSNPLVPSNYRPISLCNTVYKVAANILMNRMSSFLPKLISEEQAAFLKGRSLSDQVLIAQKVIHKFRHSHSTKGLVAFKIDMEQAFDYMGWPTLRKAMKYFGFPTKFSSLILECIQDSKFSILINGNLSNWIEETKFKMVKEVKSVLKKFYEWSGLCINLNKSSMIFGKMVNRRLKKSIVRIMGFKIAKELNYLGIKLVTRRLAKEDFQFIIDKALKMTNIWGGRHISLAGKILLSKSILLSFTICHCTNFLVPNSVLDEIDKICRNFIWNKSNGNNGIHYVNWNLMCLPMAYGGRGLHSCCSIVGPLTAKLAWRYMEDKDSLLHRILFPKYGSVLEEGVSRRAGSASWKILSDVGNCLKPIIRWNVVNGVNIDVFSDTWILDKSLNKWPTFVIPHDDNSFTV